jgi:alkyl sulfatase BDS1-like metallo-beta-lactamase superfamily hydrolase
MGWAGRQEQNPRGTSDDKLRTALTISLIAFALTPQPLFAQSRDAEPATRAANEAFIKSLPFSDRDDFAAGQYRWVASVASQLVFADPLNKDARNLGADALEQLGYQSEAATWRNAYLLGAAELRGGVPAQRGDGANAELLKGVSIDLAFDFIGVRLNAAKAEGKTIVVNWSFTDLNQSYVMNLENSALTHTVGKLSDNADVGVKLTRATLDAITLKQRTLLGGIASGDFSISGNPLKLGELFGLLDEFAPGFEVVEPKKASVE